MPDPTVADLKQVPEVAELAEQLVTAARERADVARQLAITRLRILEGQSRANVRNLRKRQEAGEQVAALIVAEEARAGAYAGAVDIVQGVPF